MQRVLSKTGGMDSASKSFFHAVFRRLTGRRRFGRYLKAAADSPNRSDMAEIAPPHGLDEADAGASDSRRAEARLRDSDLFLLVLALAAGVAAGIGVVVIDLLLALLRWLAFGIPEKGHLSDIDLGWSRVVAMPILGGLLVGLAATLLRRWRPREIGRAHV